MDIKSLKQMFMNHRYEDADGTNPITVGIPFPFSVEEYNFTNKFVICSVSLYCKICVDLLPKLGEYSRDFILLTDGTELESEEIIKEFEYSFPVLAIEYDSFHSVIVNTPCLILVDTNGIILKIEAVDTIEDVNRFIEESRY